MNGPFADEYWKAAEKEIITLEGMVPGMLLTMKTT